MPKSKRKILNSKPEPTKFLSIGIMLEGLVSDQISEVLTTNINRYLQTNYNVDFIIYNNLIPAPGIQPLFSLMNIGQVYRHMGPLIATSIMQVPLFKDIPARNPFYYYMLAPEWEAHPHLSDKEWEAFYKNPNIKLISVHPELTQKVEARFNIKVPHFIPNVDISALVTLLRSHATYVEEKLQPALE